MVIFGKIGVAIGKLDQDVVEGLIFTDIATVLKLLRVANIQQKQNQLTKEPQMFVTQGLRKFRAPLVDRSFAHYWPIK